MPKYNFSWRKVYKNFRAALRREKKLHFRIGRIKSTHPKICVFCNILPAAFFLEKWVVSCSFLSAKTQKLEIRMPINFCGLRIRLVNFKCGLRRLLFFLQTLKIEFDVRFEFEIEKIFRSSSKLFCSNGLWAGAREKAWSGSGQGRAGLDPKNFCSIPKNTHFARSPFFSFKFKVKTNKSKHG